MTILGAICDVEAACIWADSLVTDAGTGEPDGHQCKMTVNALAGAIGVGKGWSRLAQDASAAMLAGENLDDAVQLACRALRKGAPRYAAAYALRGASFIGCGYLIAGWSAELGRMIAYDLDASAFFEPEITTRCLYPFVQSLQLGLPDQRGVARIAARQASLIAAPAGFLTVATITPHGIAVHSPSEIAAMPVPDGAVVAPVAAGSTAVQSRPGVSAGPDGTSAPHQLAA